MSLCAVLRESPLLLVVGTVPERDLPSLWHGSNLRSQGLQEVKALHCSDSKHNPRMLSGAGVWNRVRGSRIRFNHPIPEEL